jgi:segregation and condensation protein B
MSRPSDSQEHPEPAATPSAVPEDSVAEHELWPPVDVAEADPLAESGPAPASGVDAVDVVDHGAPPTWATETPSSDEGGDTAEALAPLSPDRLRSVIESLLFASERPLTAQRIAELLEELAATPRDASGPPLYQPAQIQDALAQLELSLRVGDRGIELHQVAGGWQLRTAAQNAPWVQRLLQAKPVRLSRAQLETMAIVAYRQPVTRPEIDDIRGVDSGGALKTLLDRQMVRVLGKKEEPGRPLLYGTTREFLEFFNLRDLKDLPTLREYNELTDENREKMRALGHEPPLPGTVIVDPLVAPSPVAPVGPVSIDPLATPGEVTPSPLATPAAGAPPAAPDSEAPPDAAAPGGSFFTRRELIDQQLADDAEQLAKIDEMIRAVNTAFPLLDPALAATLPDLTASIGGQAKAADPAPPTTQDADADAEPDTAADDESAGAREPDSDDDREPEEL